jgi:hypothetical protein
VNEDEQEAKRILEKYGGLLNDEEKKELLGGNQLPEERHVIRGANSTVRRELPDTDSKMCKIPETNSTSGNKGKKYLSRLPEGTPISKNIFQPGFYYDGKYIRFRTSVWRAVVPYRLVLVNLFITLLFLLFAWFAFKEGSFLAVAICAFLSLNDKLGSLYSSSLFPPTGFDPENKIIYCRSFSVRTAPFSGVRSILIKDIFKITGRQIYGKHILLMLDSDEMFGHRFHFWEEGIADRYIRAVMTIIDKQLEIRSEIR